MTLKPTVLTLAITLALAGCASDNVASTDTTGRPPAGMQNFDRLPDNPQVPANDKSRIQGTLAEQDATFIREVEAGNDFEISAGQKALLKSSDANIKSLAQHMVDDHSKAEKQLAALASRKGLATESGMTLAQIDMIKQLDAANGADFDRQYLNQQLSAHQETVLKFERAATNADDKDLRDWASATLPTLRGHLSMIRDQSNVTNANPTPAPANNPNPATPAMNP